MSKLEELIQELCPDGVEYKPFFDIAKYIRGVTYNKSCEVTDGSDGYKLLRANNITLANNSLNLDDIKTINFGVKVKDEQFLKKDDILICAGSGSKDHIGKVAFISEDMKYTFGGFMGVIRANIKFISPRYLYHILTSKMFKEHLYKISDANSTTINNINNNTWKKFFVPIPPLEVQKEIVRLLDNFTAKTAELQDKLNEELETRKKQYEYYRSLLLNANKSNTVMKLGDVADVGVGNKPVEILNDSTDYEYINAGTTNSGYTHEWNCSGDTVTTPSRGQGGIGFVGYQSNNFWLGPLCYKIKSNKDWVTTKYLYYILSNSTEELLSLKKTGGVPALNRSDLIQMKISIPSLEEQNHIVDILDQFDSTYNNLKITLPTEIESRQKQYEFYRDKLLTFKELNESEVN